MGGMNSLLSVEHSPSIPLVSKRPTLILGMDVSHGSPGRSDVPSIAAVIFSLDTELVIIMFSAIIVTILFGLVREVHCILSTW